MSKITMVALLALSLFLGSSLQQTLNAGGTNFESLVIPAGTPIIDMVESGLHQLSWSSVSGSGEYAVRVVDLNTNQVFAQFSTAGTSSLLYSLTTGHLYRFTVTKGVVVQTLEQTINN